MGIEESSNRAAGKAKRNWIKYLLIAFICEKIIQHILVTIAFYFNWGDIGSTVAVNPGILMILGGDCCYPFYSQSLGNDDPKEVGDKPCDRVIGTAAPKRGQEHHFSTSFWVAKEGRPRFMGGCQRGRGTLKLNNSVGVQI
jgi:hypothetical protein